MINPKYVIPDAGQLSGGAEKHAPEVKPLVLEPDEIAEF